MFWELVAQGLNAGLEICLGSHSVSGNGKTVLGRYDESLPTIAGMAPDRLIIFPQVTIDRYRADFVIAFDSERGKRRSMLVVECDGHDYHERTKEQARHDRARDRKMQEMVGKVFRFTGSEIYAEPSECAREIIKSLYERAEFAE